MKELHYTLQRIVPDLSSFLTKGAMHFKFLTVKVL